MMRCRDLIEFLMDYLAGELPEPQAAEFEKHLAACTSCVAYMNTYQKTVELGKQAFADPDALVPEEVPEQLVKAILGARSKGK